MKHTSASLHADQNTQTQIFSRNQCYYLRADVADETCTASIAGHTSQAHIQVILQGLQLANSAAEVAVTVAVVIEIFVAEVCVNAADAAAEYAAAAAAVV